MTSRHSAKTRLAGTGDLAEVGAGYTFFWSGKAADEPSEAGVGFVIRTVLIPKLETLPEGINDRLMTMRISLAGNTNLTLISAYAPTTTNPEEDKEQFYQVLRDTLRSVPGNDKLLQMDDFNARTGRYSGAWPTVIGPHGLGRENANGLLLLTFFSEEGLTITNTLFKQPEIHRVTWMHPRSKHWHLIDYVITRRRDIRDILITRAMRGTTAGPTMRCLGAEQLFQLSRKHRRQASSVKKKVDVKKLSEPQV